LSRFGRRQEKIWIHVDEEIWGIALGLIAW
jgi:hypothetical protein